MKVFINYDNADRKLARRAAVLLKQAGLDVWLADDEIFPGDNWAAITAKALEESEAMVVLMTPTALKSFPVRANVSFALGNINYENRLVTVFVGDVQNSPDVPGFLRHLPIFDLNGDPDKASESFQQVARTLQMAA